MFDSGMSFGLGEELDALRDTVQRFARDEIAPHAAAIETKDSESAILIIGHFSPYGMSNSRVDARHHRRTIGPSPTIVRNTSAITQSKE